MVKLGVERSRLMRWSLELDTKITGFFKTNAKLFTKAQWIKAYPKATEKSYF